MTERIYVSTQGNDENTGMADAPLKTPYAARDKALVLVEGGFQGQIDILFEGGIYEFDRTFEITARHSGSEKVKIRYCGVGEGEVCFSGGITVKGKDFTRLDKEDVENRLPEWVREKILCLDLKRFSDKSLEYQKRSGFCQDIIPSANELFVDNRAEVLGGFPKNNCRTSLNRIIKQQDFSKGNTGGKTEPYTDYGFCKEDYAIIGYDFPEGDQWGKAKDALVHYVQGFVDSNIPVDHFDTEKKEIHFGDFCKGSITNSNYINSYRVFNLLEEVTTPGEYYIDRERGILFYYPYEGFGETSKIQVSYLKEPMVAVEDCKNITFENITFENTRGMAIYSDNSEKLVIKNCIFRNIGMVAVSFGLGFEETVNIVHNATLRPKRRAVGGLKAHMWEHLMFNRQAGKDNLLIGCEIYNTGCGGVIIDGGDRERLTPGNTHVVDCDIHNFNRIDFTYRPGVRIFGVGNSVSFCKIHSAPQMAVEIMGNDISIAYNEIYDCCQDSYDNAAVYIGSEQFSMNSFNTNVFCNYFHDNCVGYLEALGVYSRRSETYDLYLDGHPGTNVYMNIVERSNASEAMFVNWMSMYNHLYNNVFINVSGLMLYVQYGDERGAGTTRTKSYDPFCYFGLSEENQAIWKARYPEMENYKDMTRIPYMGHRFSRNLHFGKGHMVRGASNFMEYKDNCHFDNADYCNDVKTANYLFEENSVIFKKCPEFQNIPVKYIANYARYKEENTILKS